VPGTGIEPQLVPPGIPNPTRVHAGRARGQQRPAQGPRRQKQTTGPVPLLVEVRSITDIAQSAFSLLNTHQTRLDRADLGLAQGDANHGGEQQQQVEEDEGPVPRFPRGMLRFELSDGCTTFRAIEFRSLAELELGVTPLGYKVRFVCLLGVYSPLACLAHSETIHVDAPEIHPYSEWHCLP
jgi:RecQ-mediated genome instability protein 1